jgi:hypothetical protein
MRQMQIGRQLLAFKRDTDDFDRMGRQLGEFRVAMVHAVFEVFELSRGLKDRPAGRRPQQGCRQIAFAGGNQTPGLFECDRLGFALFGADRKLAGEIADFLDAGRGGAKFRHRLRRRRGAHIANPVLIPLHADGADNRVENPALFSPALHSCVYRF